MSGTPQPAEIIMQAIDSRLIDVHTALPGRVLSYDSDTQTVDIELQVKRMVEDREGVLQEEELPNLKNIKVAFPRSKKMFMTFPLAKGDFVWVMFSESSIDQWRSKGALVPPGDARRHTLTGAMAYPGGYPNTEDLTKAHPTAMVMGQDNGNRIYVHAGGKVEITSDDNGDADEEVALAYKLASALSSAADAAASAAAPNDGGKVAFETFDAALDGDDWASGNLKADE